MPQSGPTAKISGHAGVIGIEREEILHQLNAQSPAAKMPAQELRGKVFGPVFRAERSTYNALPCQECMAHDNA